MSDDWAAVAAAVNARVAELRMTQQDLASRSKVSPATIREIQHNHRPRRRYGRTLAALSEALEWPSDHLDAVLTGRPAGDVETPTAATDDAAVLGELRAIREELHGIRQRLDALEGGAGPADRG
ncbi:MAG: XRE family transcriptional regulator [Actinomycetales bacterium]|nr:XRE family transcriptional regulator [Actinomycetales bacterium]